MEDEIKLIHQKVNDIISKPSRWFFNWGIVVTFFTILLLVSVSFVVPYKEQLTCKLYFSTRHDIVHIKSNATGVLQQYEINPDRKISKGDMLAQISTAGNKIAAITSPINGFCLRTRFEPRIGDSVKNGATILYILPDITEKDELYCVGYLNKFDISKLNVGNKVTISIEQYDKQFVVNGVISSISNYPARNNTYPFYVSLQAGDVAELNQENSFYYKMSANAQIIYKTEKLANKFLSF
jgi:multidrug resistance efflux pump